MSEGRDISPIFLKDFKNTVEKILHVPGNFTGSILEMAVVIDKNLTKEQVLFNLPELLKTLKRHSETFRNVRLNLVYWESDAEIETAVSPLSAAMLNSFYDDYSKAEGAKTLEALAGYLKLYHARSKLIILLTDGRYRIGQEETLRANMRPFLEKKLMQVTIKENGSEVRYRL